jgi:hypothetical protein
MLANCSPPEIFPAALNKCFPTAPGDEIATSRGIFMPHFATVSAYVEVKDFECC